MKIDENAVTSNQLVGILTNIQKDAERTEEAQKVSLEENDIITLDIPEDFPKEMISKGNALDALSKVIREMNQIPEETFNSINKQFDSNRTLTLLQF